MAVTMCTTYTFGFPLFYFDFLKEYIYFFHVVLKVYRLGSYFAYQIYEAGNIDMSF